MKESCLYNVCSQSALIAVFKLQSQNYCTWDLQCDIWYVRTMCGSWLNFMISFFGTFVEVPLNDRKQKKATFQHCLTSILVIYLVFLWLQTQLTALATKSCLRMLNNCGGDHRAISPYIPPQAMNEIFYVDIQYRPQLKGTGNCYESKYSFGVFFLLTKEALSVWCLRLMSNEGKLVCKSSCQS